MFVEKIYEFVMFLKNQGQSQWFSPEEIIDALNRAQLDKYRSEHKQFEATQKVTDSMRPFKSSDDISITATKGDLPGDYFSYTNISSLVTEGEVESEYKGKVYTDGEWLDAKESTLLPPDDENMKARIVGDSVEVTPSSITKVRLYYLKKPVDAVYAYDLEEGKITFKETGSVDPEWPETEHNDLVMRTLKYLGVPLRDSFFVQAEQMMQQPATT